MSGTRRKRVAVLGSDFDGLIAALATARDGNEVTLIEEGLLLGGPAAGVEVAPGYRAPLLLDRGRLRGDLLRRLDLPADRLAPPPVQLQTEGEHASRPPQEASTAERFLREADELRGWARRLVHRSAPPLDPRRDWRRALTTGLSTRMLGKRRLRRLARIATTPIGDWLRESIQDGPVAAALAGPALEGTVGGPMAAGTSLNYLLRLGASGAAAAAGLPALVDDLVHGLTQHAVDVRCREPLAGVHAVDDHWVVHLESDEAIEVDAVVSALSPQRLFGVLLQGAQLPVEMAESVRNLRNRGNVGVVQLALDAAPPDGLRTPAAIHCMGWTSLEALELAADECKHGRTPKAPPIECAILSRHGGTRKATDASVIVAHVRFCPRDADRRLLVDIVSNSLESLWPRLNNRLTATRAWTPADLERDFRLPGGHLEHADWAMDQLLFLRPDASCVGGATPLPGLSICGPGCHPGVGLHGGAGAWAAKRV